MRKVQIFFSWHQKVLGPKIWTQGPNHLKTNCWGPGESIDTHIVGFCEKIANFFNLRSKAPWAKIWLQGPNHPKMIAGVQASPYTFIAWFSEKIAIF